MPAAGPRGLDHATELAGEQGSLGADLLTTSTSRACLHADPRFDGFVAKYMGDGVLAYSVPGCH